MPVHEQQAALANDNVKLGLAGDAGGRVEDASAVPQIEYALGNISPAQDATVPQSAPA